MGHKSLQARFVTPVSLFILLVVLGGAFVFSTLEHRRITHELKESTQKAMAGLIETLSVTDALLSEQTHASMRLLIERGNAQGMASLGSDTQVKGKVVPNLLLGGKPQANVFDLVDGVTKVMGGTATVFVRQGQDFVRISTNVKKDNERAVGTVLDPNGKAIKAIREGKAFYGVVDILGNPFWTGYEPIRDAQGQVIGIWYVGYKIDLGVLKQVIEASRLLETGYIALFDAKGALRFRSGHVSEEQVKTLAEGDNHPWDRMERVFEPWNFKIQASYPHSEVNALTQQRTFTIVGVGLLGCGVLIAMMVLLLKQLVLKPLGGEPAVAAEVATRIAGGDLTVSIPLAVGDKVSMMAAIAQMRDGLLLIVRRIQEGATALNAASENLVQMAGKVSSGVSRQNDATASIAATLEEVTVSIRHVADSAETANQMASSAGGLSCDGSSTVNEAVQEMHASAEAVNQSAVMVERLGESSRQITAIVNTIKEIADQTNLLALNAAIEAARAGEQGRGFAVVADEVRKLAERTSTSTHEIASMIVEIQKSTTDAIAGIEDGARRVNGSVHRAAEAGGSMEQIQSATSSVVEAVNAISEALREQTAASENIARNVEQVASMNEENSYAVQGVVSDAQRLQALANDLRTSVSSFRV